MTWQTHDLGEELIARILESELSHPADLTWLIFNDQQQDGDDLTPQSRLDDITTEPDGSDYGRITYQWGTDTFVDLSGGDSVVVLDPADDSIPTFETSDATTVVDSWAVLASWQSDKASDSSATLHLVSSGSLGDRYELDKFEYLQPDTMGINISGQV